MIRIEAGPGVAPNTILNGAVITVCNIPGFNKCTVQFSLSSFPACCGVVVIHNVRVYSPDGRIVSDAARFVGNKSRRDAVRAAKGKVFDFLYNNLRYTFAVFADNDHKGTISNATKHLAGRYKSLSISKKVVNRKSLNNIFIGVINLKEAAGST